jgi:hypothetical protein
MLGISSDSQEKKNGRYCQKNSHGIKTKIINNSDTANLVEVVMLDEKVVVPL